MIYCHYIECQKCQKTQIWKHKEFAKAQFIEYRERYECCNYGEKNNHYRRGDIHHTKSYLVGSMHNTIHRVLLLPNSYV